MCVFVFPPHLSLLGNEFKSGWCWSVQCFSSRSLWLLWSFTLLKIFQLFIHRFSACVLLVTVSRRVRLAAVLPFVHSEVAISRRAWTSSSCHLCSFSSSVLFLSWSRENLLIKFAAARWFKHGGCAEVQKAAVCRPPVSVLQRAAAPLPGANDWSPCCGIGAIVPTESLFWMHYSIFFQSSYRQFGFQSGPVSDTDPLVVIFK